MKTSFAYLVGFFGMLIAMLAPMCALFAIVTVIEICIWGPSIFHADKYHPATLILLAAMIPGSFLMVFGWSHYTFRILIPWYARMKILKVGDKKNREQWINWVQVSLKKSRQDCEALENYCKELSAQNNK